ncbi:MAG: prepilin-type N-terminal cleavage/methylation domain-containing protein [Burkholderiales bacterium]|nr:prepilin-type N-terminal cleavage/methylation domain-containing protein [Burkholderiales bacterium]
MKNMKSIKSQQSGFTLVEIAIVLVIIGLLLGGILKGQELINSAKVKNLAQDFKAIPLYIYGYQDRFKALPGDDIRAATNLPTDSAGAPAIVGNGDGALNGVWSATAPTAESYMFWQHVRLGNFAPGPTAPGDPTYGPKNVEGGQVGIQSGTNPPFTGMRGTYIYCSAGILGKYAKQLDLTLDDGNSATGSLMIGPVGGGVANSGSTVPPEVLGTIDDAKTYTVCLAF